MDKEELKKQRVANALESNKLLYEHAEKVTGQSTSQRVADVLRKHMITPIFYPGQRVVCVNDSFEILKAQDPSIITPIKGEEYTIRKNFQLLHNVGVALMEIDNNHAIPKGRKLEPNFAQDRFSPLPEAGVLVQEEVDELQAA